MENIFIGYTGTGLIVCDKSITINNDYKKLAFVSKAGNISWYVNVSEIDCSIVERINSLADNEFKNFKDRFEAISIEEQYQVILDAVPVSKLCDFLKDDRGISEKIGYMRDYYYSIL